MSVPRLLDAFEEALEELRIAYEKYFSGVDRQAPAQQHQRLKRQLRQIEQLRPRSTALRFRLSGLKARLVTYQHYWTRILTQIEKGTFRRDIQQRVSRRRAEAEARRASPEPSPEADEPPEPVPELPRRTRSGTLVNVPALTGQAPPPLPKGPPTPPKPPPPPVPGMKAAEVQQLFRTLVKAKQAAGEDTQGLTYRALVRKLSREAPKLRQRHGGPVRFEVTTVEGKVRLRARVIAKPE